jgi:hypothetical protein
LLVLPTWGNHKVGQGDFEVFVCFVRTDVDDVQKNCRTYKSVQGTEGLPGHRTHPPLLVVRTDLQSHLTVNKTSLSYSLSAVAGYAGPSLFPPDQSKKTGAHLTLPISTCMCVVCVDNTPADPAASALHAKQATSQIQDDRILSRRYVTDIQTGELLDVGTEG